MPTYEVELRSPVDAQFRVLTLDAESVQAARDHAERAERDLAEFSLLPPDRETWEQPPGSREDEDGLVDLSRWDAYDPVFARHAASLGYEDAVSAAKSRLDDWRSRSVVTGKGKVRGDLGKRSLARLAAHLQADPFTVADVREVSQAEVDVQRLVRELAAMHQDDAQWNRVLEEMRAQGIPMNVVTAAVHGIAVQPTDDGSSPTVWGTGSGGNTINAALLTGYTPNVDTHQFWSSAVANEISGTGYTANGVTLATKTSGYDTTTDQTRLGAANATWATSTLSATVAAVVNRTPATDATRPLLGNITFNATVTTTAGTFTIAWDATGIIVRDYT